jgi:hypothetical protein
MANYRQIHTQIWRDNWFLELRPDEKLLFIYLFSNDSTNLAGIYEIHESIIALETGLRPARIREILVKLEASNKVHYGGGVVWIVNMRKYHSNASEKVQKNIDAAIYDIQDGEIKNRYCIANGITLENTVSIPYGYHMDTLSHSKSKSKLNSKSKTEEEEEAQPETPEGGTVPYSDPLTSICEYYKLKTGKLETKEATKLQELTVAYRSPDIRNAIDHMTAHTERPNPGYLQKVLDGWFAERKIQKNYAY